MNDKSIVKTKNVIYDAISFSPVLIHYIWGVIDDKCLICTETKNTPYIGVKCRLLYEVGCVRTNKPVYIKDLMLPQIGDIGKTTKGNKIEIVFIK